MWEWLQRIGLFEYSSSSPPEAGRPELASHRLTGTPPPRRQHSARAVSRVETSSPSEKKDWSSEQWVEAFRQRDLDAITALRKRLARGLVAALRRAASKRKVPRRTEALAKEAAREATIGILDDPDAFRGEREEDAEHEGVDDSRFTTWAQKIAVHIAFTKLRRDE